ncbi:MAG: hypothetical protein F9K40_06095 [Kofleriaceae bacterium]|nr:MAG: hypothetical protein F9K40_06095 [Kofleriaceae bacterium]MBZ0232678.1 hypothetical protein [Kofleriaceae bacterium]
MAAPGSTRDDQRPLHWTERMQSFDRRWIFLAMAFAVVLPLFFPLNLPAKPDPMTKAAFNAVESLPQGARVFVSMDFDPASTPEIEPFYRAVMLHLKRKEARVAIATTWYQAPPLVERLIRETVDQAIAPAGTEGYSGLPDRPYRANVDYVYLGFRDGKGATIAAMGSDLRKVFDGRANDGTPLDQIPMMNGIKRLEDFDLLVLVSAGFPGAKEYIQFVGERYKLRMITAVTAVSTTDMSPYFQTGQLAGLVGGMAGSAGYEYLVGKKGSGTAGADVLNVGNVVVIFAIIFGNVIFFAGRVHRRRHGARRARA